MRTRQSFQLELEPLRRQEQFPVALEIVRRLRRAGYETVFAGGCVRDGLLGMTPKDLDLATAAPPDEVERVFERTLAVGKAFGTIVVIKENFNFEVTTFRRETDYKDGRHPEKVEFTDLEEDANRRDFTVNALFYDPIAGTLIDCVQGLNDLKAKRLRTVGKAEDRFKEDRLRMLRAPRFVAQLGFVLNEEAVAAIQNQHEAIAQVSAERIFAEMKRLLTSPYSMKGLSTFRETKLDAKVWPESRTVDLSQLEKLMPFLNWEHAFAAVMILSKQNDVATRLQAWKASKESIRKVQLQMSGLKTLIDMNSSRAERARVLGGDEYAETLELARGFLADDQLKTYIHEFLAVSDAAGGLPKPFLNGQDLISQGVEPGQRMGSILKTIYDEQLAGKLRSKAEALERLKDL